MTDVVGPLMRLRGSASGDVEGAVVPEAGAVRPRHPLVTTLEQLDALDVAEMVDGHLSAERGDPEPGTNHSLAYCHGWRTRMYDLQEIPTPPQHRNLVREYVQRMDRTRP